MLRYGTGLPVTLNCIHQVWGIFWTLCTREKRGRRGRKRGRRQKESREGEECKVLCFDYYHHLIIYRVLRSLALSLSL